MSSDSDLPQDASSVFSEFLTDYFVECDEHLATARQSLLTLEPTLLDSTLDQELLDGLFRSFHSLKGLSAMVGFHDAEQLAHHLETVLGAVRTGQAKLDVPGLEVLMAGLSTLEKVIAARRDSLPAPDVSSLLKKLVRLVPEGNGASAGGSGRGPAASTSRLPDKAAALATKKLQTGARLWLVTFEPSARRVELGIDVNSIRARLQALGDIVHSTPVIGSEGQVKFSFLLASHAAEPAVMALQGEGVTTSHYEFLPPTHREHAESPKVEARHVPAPSTHLTPANIVRVDLQRLDELMRLVGELVLSRARLEDGLQRVASFLPAAHSRHLQETNAAIERQLRDLRDGVMRVRMVPIREVFARMQFVVRDLVRESEKQVVLRSAGEETQIDKYVVERIMDPLLHLVRNAVSHGLESPSERAAAGKPSEGHVDLRATTVGETVVIEVEDDGRGIDADSLLGQARAKGIVPTDVSKDASTLLNVLCVPGFSTREQPDRASGRGIGMDVVRRAVEEMGGSLALRTTVGEGTCFKIVLPLTLSITEALIVQVNSEKFAIPQIAVREVLSLAPDTHTFIENNELLRYHGSALPVVRLSRLFGRGQGSEGQVYALVIGEGAQAIGLAVDRVLGLREVVVRSLTDRLVHVPGIAGATELGDGNVVLILDAANIGRMARGLVSAAKLPPSAPHLDSAM